MKTNPRKIIAQLSVLVFLLLAGAGSALAQSAQTLYATPSTLTWRNNYTGGSGCQFTVGSTNVVVSHLGFFQSNAVSSASIIAGGGLNDSHQVGIYSSTVPPVLLAQVVVPPGTAADYFTNQFCWMPLDPPFLLLSNTTYYVAAMPYNGDGDLWGDTFTATFNTYFIGVNASSCRSVYGPGNSTWPISGFSYQGQAAPCTYCVESLANIPVDQARVVVPSTNVAVLTGGTLSVVGYATGQQPISYQWFQPGSPATPVPNQTNSTLNIPNATAANSGTYYLTASNALGGEQSANVQVLVSNSRVGVEQNLPVGITNFANYPLTLSMVVTGAPAIFLEWSSNGVPLPSTITYDSSSFTLPSSYSLIPVYPANNGNLYDVVASNSLSGSPYYATSTVTALTVLPNLAYPQGFLHGPPPTNVFNSNGGLGSAGNNQCGGSVLIGSHPVVVTHLGYDAVGLVLNNLAALQDSHNITIYSTNGTLLGNAVVTNGTLTSSAINGYLWAPLNPPLVLAANTPYILSAQTFASGSAPIDPWGDTYGVTDWNPYFTPGGANNTALYGNTWPTAPASGGYGSQMYSAPNLGILTNVSAVFVSNSPVVYPNFAAFAGSISNVSGTSLALIGSAEGAPPLYYPQWYFDGAPLAGQTNASLVIPSLTSANGGTYYLVVSNYQTSLTVTSAVTAVTILTNPVILGQFPITYTNILNTNLMTLYAGASPTFSVSAIGATPFFYQWFANGAVVAGATNASFKLANVQPAGATNFYCIITNIYGSATSTVWSASVIADPVNTAGLAPYPQSVLALNPIGYWRLNDTNLDGVDNGSGDDGYLCNDYAGGNNGIYTNVDLGEPGYNPVSDPSDTAVQVGLRNITDCDANSIAGINFGSPAGTSKAFTVEAWVNGYPQAEDAGLVTVGYGGSEQFNLDTGSDTAPTTHGFRFFIRDAAGATHLVASTNIPSYGTWYHLVGVVDEITNQTVTFYINGQSVGTAAVTNGSGILASSIPMSIGARMAGQTTTYNDQFVGDINDVAVFNYALSANQVLNQYLDGGQVAPYLNPAPPVSITAVAGSPMTIPATALGSPQNGFQWVDTSTSAVLASGTGNGGTLNAAFLTNSAQYSWNGHTFQLTVTNAYGTTNFNVAVTVTRLPVIVTDLPPSVIVGQRQTYTYSLGAIGLPTLTYQWYEGGGAVSGATNSTFAPPTTSAGTNSVYVVVTNPYGTATSSTSTFVVVALPNTPLANTIAGLNPVAYWPMHETGLPTAPGDIETNYGVSGLAETGYYPDWYASSGASAFQHGFPGAIAGDSDTAVCFNTNAGVGNGAYTNALYVPNATKGAVLNPPFSVECWFFPSNTSANDLWSQEGYEGQNAGTEGGGGGNVCGIRLYVGGNYNVYTYANNSSFSQPLASIGTVVATNWYHVVLTCDAGTNISLYTNGVQCGTNTPYAGLYFPDSWTPFEVGSGRGNTRAKSNVAVDELAIYTNALSAAQILTDYQTGINPAPATSYFATITNKNPWIYYRMDSPAYTVPPASSLPALYNYGSVVQNGVYSPGTLPGVLPGPSSTYTTINQGTNVALLEGISSYGDAGYNPVWDPSAKYGTSNQAFSVTCMFRGNPANNEFMDLVGHSDNSWRMTLGANAAGGGAAGSVQFTYGATASSTINCNDGKWHQAVGVYQPGSTASPGTVLLYVDGQLNTVNTTVSSNGIAGGSSLDLLLGAAPDYTNSPYGLGRQFNGELCDVAIFTNALTAAQVQALYNNAGGVVQTLAMPYSGQLPVTWSYLGGNLGNNLGATNLMTLYAGASPSFMVTVSGAPVNSYQWFTNGAAVGFGTNAILTVPNVHSAFSTYCIATNSISSVTSVVWSASVVVDPDAAGSFSQTVLGDSPVAYWRLNEAAGSTIAVDYAGGANGQYGSQTTNGLPGVPILSATPELGVLMNPSAANNANGSVTNAGVVLNTNCITFVVWELPTTAENAYNGTFVNRSTAGFSGVGLSGNPTWGADWNNNGNTYGFNSGLSVPPVNQWFMGVVEVFPQYYVLATFTNTSAGYALSAYVTNFSATIPVESFYGGAEIGCDPATSLTRIWHGEINELAIFNYDLSPAQLNALYQSGTNGALTAPLVVTQPANATVAVGTARTGFTAGVSSFVQPLTYQWYYNTAASYTGATALANGLQANGSWATNVATAQLAITNVTFGAAGYYFVAAGNSIGTNNSAIASLAVTPVTTPTNIVVSLVGGTNLVLSWPANWTGWRLLAQTDSLSTGLGTNWVTVTGSNGTNNVAIPVCPTNSGVFYKLVYP